MNKILSTVSFQKYVIDFFFFFALLMNESEII